MDKVQSQFLNNNCEYNNTQGGTTEDGIDSTSSNTTGRTPTQDRPNNRHIVIPYTQGLGESIKKMCSKYGIKIHFKTNRIIKELLVKPKDKDPVEKKSRTIHLY